MNEEIEATQPEDDDIKAHIAEQLEAVETVDEPAEVPEETAEAKEARLRDEKGRFAAKQEEEQAQPETEEQYQARLNGYSKEEREVLAKLPPDVQKIIDAREEKFHRGIDPYRSSHAFAQNIAKNLAPDAQFLQQYNITPADWIDRLVTTERQLRTGDAATKLRLIQGLANDYGIDLQHISQVPFDPNAYQMQQRLQEYERKLQNHQASTQSAEVAQAAEYIQQFGANREYFDQLRPVMADLLDKGLATDLNEAYEKAIRLDNGVFEKWQAAQLEQRQRQELERANHAAKTAKAAAVSVKSGAPLGRTALPEPANTRDAVAQAFAQHGY